MANELQTVRAALLGDSEAAAQIHRKHHPLVLGALMNRGALMQLTRSEVEECEELSPRLSIIVRKPLFFFMYALPLAS